MKTLPFLRITLLAIVSLVFAGCANTKPVNYAAFREHRPHSILVLPPLNHSTKVEGTYGYLSTVTMPLAEMGYYVFPVAEVDEILKENGMPTAGEMHQVPLNKVSEIIGADAVLYITLDQYGSKYQVINSATIVEASAKLVDTKTGMTLWEGHARAQENSGGSSNIIADLIAAAVTQAVNSSTDEAHSVSREANAILFTTKGQGLLYGPYNPNFTKENN
jgi:hypothetical protein